MRNHPKRGLVFLCGLLAGAPVARPQAPAGGDALATTLLIMDMQLRKAVDAALYSPFVTAADKEKIGVMARTMHDGIDKAAAEFRAQGAGAELMQVQQQAVALSEPLTMLLNSRHDLMQLGTRYEFLKTTEGKALESKPAELLALLKNAGVADGHVAKAGEILERHRAATEAAARGAGNEPNPQALNALLRGKTWDTLQAIDALLTPDERLDYEWAVIKSVAGLDDVTIMTIGYSTQPAVAHAPQDGSYRLKATVPNGAAGAALDVSSPRGGSRGGVPPALPRELRVVKLKKGDPLGFKPGEKGVAAVAGTERVEVPPDAIFAAWEFVK